MQNPDPQHNAVLRAYFCLIVALLGIMALNANAMFEAPSFSLRFSSLIAEK